MEECLREQRALQSKLSSLDEYVKSRQEENKQRLSKIREGLESIKIGEAARLITLTDETESTASRMSDSIRRLDREQTRILDVLQLLGRVERIRELMTRLGEITVEDRLEEACGLVHEIDTFPTICLAAYETRYGSDSMQDIKSNLLKIILSGFDKESPDFISLFGLLDQIGMQKEGIIRYSTYLNEKARSNVAALIALPSTIELATAGKVSRLCEYALVTLRWTFDKLVVSEEERQIVGQPFLEIVEDGLHQLVIDFLESPVEESLLAKDLRLTELSLIGQHLQSYLSSVSSFGSDSNITNLLNSTLASTYLEEELAYVQLGIKRAMEIAEAVDLLSSFVDDTFFLTRKAVLRAPTPLAFSRLFPVLMTKILPNCLLAPLEKQLRTGIHQTDSLEAKKTFALALNNMTASAAFTASLVDELKDLDDDLIEAAGALQNQFKASAKSGLTILYKSILKSKYSSILSSSLMAQGLDEKEALKKYTTKLDALLAEPNSWLTEDNQEALAHLICSDLTSIWSKHILSKQWVQASALQLDHQVRAVSAHHTDMAGISLRFEMAPLLHMAEALISESREEAEEVVSSTGIDKRVLSIRSDWS